MLSPTIIFRLPLRTGFFALWVWVCPILVEANLRGNFHRKDALASRIESRPAHANHPISDLGAFSDSWFACSKCAVSVEWIRCETEITVNHVNKHTRHASLA